MSRRRSIGALLTVLSGSLVLVTGLLLLATVGVSVRESITSEPVSIPIIQPGDPTKLSAEDAAQAKQQAETAEQRIRRNFQRHTLLPLAIHGGTALALLVLGAMWFGWVYARRILRPVKEITATARRVADRSLHERIGMTGPHDELRELADTVDGMLSRLDAAFEGQRRFVGNASHELKTPLAINRTLVEVAMNRPDAPPQLRQLGEILLEVNVRQERLIDGLLTLARSEHRVVDPMPVELGSLASGVAETVGPEADRLGVTVTVCAAPIVVEGDPVLLERMVQNLVLNGIRHNATGGWVRVNIDHAGDKATLTVTNTGPVVPAASVPWLFEPFRKAADRIGSGSGSGLGLSIVRSVTHAHAGTVEARPREGGGLVIRVDLPISAPVR